MAQKLLPGEVPITTTSKNPIFSTQREHFREDVLTTVVSLSLLIQGSITMAWRWILEDAKELFWVEVAWKGRPFAVIFPTDSKEYVIVNDIARRDPQETSTTRSQLLLLRLLDRMRPMLLRVGGKERAAARTVITILDAFRAGRGR